MVNMSRMTGRKYTHPESGDWGNSDVMRSLQYIKGSISKNIDFDKINQPTKRRKTNNNYRSYDYNLSVVRPEQKGLVDFGIVKGREQKVKTENIYNYQHYEYDSYVWKNNSSVFPNTKTHVIDFHKQIDRYKHESERL